MQPFPRGTRFIRYIDNHDITNDAYHNRIENDWGTNGVNAALAMIFTMDGLPFLYNGQEAADTSRHSIFGRLPINWAGGDTQAGKDRFSYIQKLSALRESEPSLIAGELEWIDNDRPDEIISYSRTVDGDKILVIINLSEQKVNTKLDGISKNEIKSVNTLFEEGVISDGLKGFEIQGYGFLVGKITN